MDLPLIMFSYILSFRSFPVISTAGRNLDFFQSFQTNVRNPLYSSRFLVANAPRNDNQNIRNGANRNLNQQKQEHHRTKHQTGEHIETQKRHQDQPDHNRCQTPTEQIRSLERRNNPLLVGHPMKTGKGKHCSHERTGGKEQQRRPREPQVSTPPDQTGNPRRQNEKPSQNHQPPTFPAACPYHPLINHQGTDRHPRRGENRHVLFRMTLEVVEKGGLPRSRPAGDEQVRAHGFHQIQNPLEYGIEFDFGGHPGLYENPA